jgi:hypothetical protein
VGSFEPSSDACSSIHSFSKPGAFLCPGLILANSHGYTSLTAPDKRIAHQSRHLTHDRFNISLSLLQQAEKLLGSGASVGSHDRVHVFLLHPGRVVDP